MLKLHWIEIFLRLIPEMFLVIWGISIISREPITIKKYIFLSIIMGMTTFFIRSLPIYFGVHTIIITILTIIIMIIIRIPVIPSIYGTLIMFLLLSLSEFLSILILNSFNIDTNININDINPIKKCLLGVPSMIILFLIVLLLNYILKRRKKLKNVSN